MGLPQPVITRQMVLAELIKAGIKQEIADDLSYRYYKNELTHKDIEYLKENFDIKLEKVEGSLRAEIKASYTDLDNKIDTKFTELDNKIDKVDAGLRAEIKALDNKIDNVENNLNNKIDKVETTLKSDIKELDNKIDKNTMELKSILKLHNWMFGTVITLCAGIFLTLISMIYSFLSK